jgi:hypothetical protein
MSTAGVVKQEYALPNSGSQPENIVAGPDGNLWFTEFSGNRIGKIGTGGSLHEYALPNAGSGPDGITVGPDGNLWFTEYTGGRLGSISTAGVLTEYALPTSGSHPETIVAGPDGALWFTESSAGNLGRITTAGAVLEFPVPSGTGAGVPDGIALGSDRNLWFTEFSANRVGRLIPAPVNVLLTPTRPAPAAVTAVQGATVLWTSLPPVAHAVVDSSGMGLFGSGTLSFVSYYAFPFVAAGTYAYKDSSDGGAGKVSLPLQVSPGATGTLTTTFTITWAASLPAGYVVDVQIKRPGSSSYVLWQKGVTTLSAGFTADANTGNYSFKARLRKSGGAASGYSPVLTITIS